MSKDAQFFKCVICCLKAVPEVGRKHCLEILDNTKLVHSDLHTSTYSHIDSPSTAVASSPLIEVRSELSTLSVSQKTTNNFESPVVVNCCNSAEKGEKEGNQDSDLVIDVPVSSERERIIIVDSVPNPGEYCDSARILKEVGVYSPHIPGKYAYRLVRGGIAIHLHNIEDKLTVLKSFTAEAFVGARIYDLSAKTSTLFIKGVSTAVSTECLTDELTKQRIEVTEVKRLRQSKTGRPLPVVRLVCSAEAASKLLRWQHIRINGAQCTIERRRVEVYRCYNCQRFGHLARTCSQPSRCLNCSGNHSPTAHCTLPSRCANCLGTHRSSSLLCPLHKQRYEDITSQHQKSEYLEDTARSYHSKISAGDITPAGGLGAEGTFLH